MKIKYLVILLVGVLLIFQSFGQVFHENEGKSQSVGTVSKGSLVNAYKIPYKGKGYRFFSASDYYILGRCYLHSDICKIVVNSYEEMQMLYPNYTFRIMECSKKKGGRSFPHKTHQNGTSVDFMTPLVKKGHALKLYDNIGMWRYLMEFDSSGKMTIDKKVKIDFDKMAKHILVLDKTARKNGYRIKKVILETNLKDEIYNSKYGEELRKSNIYFVRSLPKVIDKLHDDHYHIDFVKI